MSEWWKQGTVPALTDKNFQKIIEFYLLRCPCEIKRDQDKYVKISRMSTTFRQQGWVGGKLNMLISSMKNTESGHLEYHIHHPYDDVITKTEMVEKVVNLKDLHFEMISIVKRSDMSLTSSIFYYIRNALAHGSFGVVQQENKKTYYFESTKGDNVKAQIRLREDTLLKWIRNFELSPAKLKEISSKEFGKKKSYRKKAIA